MPAHLPLVEPFARDHTYCAYCPKLCRDLCPVSTVQGRETTTPWGKMSLLHHAATGRSPLDDQAPEHDPLAPAYAAAFWACTGCMRCKTGCEHENEVAAALMMGRAEAFARGAAPEPATTLARGFEARVERSATAAEQVFGAALRDRDARAAFLPGCTSPVVAPDDAAAGYFAARTLAQQPTAVEAEGCCGLPLLFAGDVAGFHRAARALAQRIAGRDLVIAGDPGCALALRVVYPRLGVEVRPRVLHLAELAGRELTMLRRGAIETDGEVRYHDACHLGRGLGAFDAPRHVLARITGRAPVELPHHHERGECSGGGGLVPLTDPATAAGIAAERAADHARAGGGTLVTGCPTARRRLEQAGLPAVDLAVWIARALGA